MIGDRDAILGRIAEALKEPAPRRHEFPARTAAAPTVTAPFREWLPHVGPTTEDHVALFASMSAMLKSEFRECADIADAAEAITRLARAGSWKRLALHSGELTDAIARALPPELEIIRTENGYEKSALETCDAGLTECDTLVAQTGSVCVTSRSAGGRALSALPAHHLVIARRSQIVPDLPAAYEQLAQRYGSDYPSFLGFITGPSRTGDIERILVLGAHGPKRLTILLVP